MPSSTLSPRDELIVIQRSIARRLRREIMESLEAPGAELRAYQKEYERSCGRGFRRVLSRRVFLSRLEAADIVYQGDFHTLRECQATALRLLRDLRRRREVVLALEAVPIAGQSVLDAYLAGELPEAECLAAIDYENTWGFTWEHYRPLFEFAREEELQVYGINAPARGEDGALRLRDRLAARVIARAAFAHPGALVYVVAGDFHVCRSHLPLAVERELAGGASGAGRSAAGSRGRRRRPQRAVIVHQNIDSFYWDLARRHEEHRARFLEMGPDEYCIMSSNPIVKYQSYLHWQLGEEELHEDGIEAGGWGSSSTVTDEVHRLVRTIARFLGVRRSDLDDFVVYTTRDLDFLADLEGRGGFLPREIREIKRQILNDESYFISRGNIIYLSRLAIDHAAEEAAHYLNNKLSGWVPRPVPRRTDFYARALKEALGFLGSKIVNPLRYHHGEDEFRELVACAPRQGDAGEAPLVRLSRSVLRHLEAERRILRGERRPRLAGLYAQDLDLHLGITHSLGYILGDKLYRGLVTESVERSEVRQLFSLPLDGRDEAEEVYFDLVRRLAPAGARRTGRRAQRPRDGVDRR
jgi:hypothetical protein